MKDANKKTIRSDNLKQSGDNSHLLLRARSHRGSDRIEGGRLPLYAYLSNDPKDDPRGPIDDR